MKKDNILSSSGLGSSILDFSLDFKLIVSLDQKSPYNTFE